MRFRWLKLRPMDFLLKSLHGIPIDVPDENALVPRSASNHARSDARPVNTLDIKANNENL